MPSRDVQDFIAHWSSASASERANSQPFLLELCDLLAVPRPDPHPANGYFFEFPVVEHNPDGTTSNGRIDLYRRKHFVLESKQFQEKKAEASQLELAAEEAGVIARKKSSQPVRGTGAWDDAMMKARGQAERYVRAIPDDNPPFIIVVDVGHSFEIYADFSQAGKAYLPFPDPRTFRVRLADLADEKIRERLRLIWTNPAALDPAKQSADVTREVSAHLAELAKSLEEAGHEPEVVAQFLTRCLFCMFAEDVELLPKDSFTELLNSLPTTGEGFEDVMRQLFREMNTGTGKGISVVLRKKLLHFNGGLFSNDTVLPINGLQLGLLKEAARQNWGNVEPAIFGTLLERALNPGERHQLGAHYTPRAYVERLVLPTVIEPLRAEWENVRAAALTQARAGDLKKARAEVNSYHERLCKVTVLDPACGSGNFLYVALQHLKVLEGEVFDVAAQFGDTFKLELERQTVDPHQFLGLEINTRAASIAELVLWIGYLQWHFRLHGKRTPPEPILRAFKNIQCRDAVLEYDGEPQPELDATGKAKTVWDRKSTKTDMVTGRAVPDETKRVPLLTYANPRPAQWPQADFIVGNPPFIGTARMREDLGDGYAETLRATYPAVPESADFVLYWWHKAAELT
ncbi:MAG: DNA methyltransferase, partial [Verrucomicrobiota bacterium]